jgi:hypothetical protein
MNITCPYCRGTVTINVDIHGVWEPEGIVDYDATVVCDDTDCGATFAHDGVVLNPPYEER